MGAKGNDEFKHPEVVAVNKFRKAMAGMKENVSTTAKGSVVVINRGDKGVAIVNLATADANIKADTKLADGTYTDKVHGTEFTVKSGKISGSLKAETSYVIY